MRLCRSSDGRLSGRRAGITGAPCALDAHESRRIRSTASLRVETHDAQGQLRDTSTLLTALGERLKRMPYDRAYAYAQALGIDEKTLNALQQGVGRFSAMYRDMLRASGLDAQAAAK